MEFRAITANTIRKLLGDANDLKLKRENIVKIGYYNNQYVLIYTA